LWGYKETTMNNRYAIRHLYRVWTSLNDAHKATYTRGVFNEVRTRLFICHEMYADKIRPVEVWVQCPECEHDEGWIAVDDVLEIGGVVECDACGHLIQIIDGPICLECNDAVYNWQKRPDYMKALVCAQCGAIIDEIYIGDPAEEQRVYY